MTESSRKHVFYYRVKPGEILEFVMSKFWSETESGGEIFWSVEFGGFKGPDTLHIETGISSIDLANATEEKLTPKIELDWVERILVPQCFEIVSLNLRYQE